MMENTEPITDIEFVDAAMLYTSPFAKVYDKVISIGVKHKLVNWDLGYTIHLSAPDNTDFAAIKQEILEVWDNA